MTKGLLAQALCALPGPDVLVSEALRDIEPMAWDFVMNFGRDNELDVVEASGK